jgi:hypothetical protein
MRICTRESSSSGNKNVTAAEEMSCYEGRPTSHSVEMRGSADCDVHYSCGVQLILISLLLLGL